MEKEIIGGDIWVFVEENLKTEIPAYFRTVLSACGFSNGFSISAIKEKDLEYIQKEVRSGNVAKVFAGSGVNYLEDCTKTAEEFEFVLGHKVFLNVIVTFLKNQLAKNGIGAFSLSVKPKRKVQAKATTSNKIKDQKIGLPSKKKSKRTGRRLDPRILPLVEYPMKTELEVQRNAPTFSAEILAKHREDLLIKTISAIVKFTPKMLEEQMEEIKNKISGKFVTFELDKDYELIATINCVYCDQTVTAYPNPSPQNPYLWKAPNFNRHLKIIHRFEDGSQESGSEKDSESNNHDEQKEELENLNRKQKETLSSVKATILKVAGERKKMSSDSVVAYQDEGKEISSGLRKGNDSQTSGPSGQEKEVKITSEWGNEKVLEITDQVEGKKMWSDLDVASEGGRKETLSDSIKEEQDSKSCGENSNTLSKEKDSSKELKLEEIPILNNGGKTRHGKNVITTKRTCALDTVFMSYACIYSENSNVQDQFGNSHSNIAEFFKYLFKWADKSTSQVPDGYRTELHTFRNTILKDVYEGWCQSGKFTKNQESIFIDCKTGIGALFARICKLENNFFSAIESKNCKICGNAFRKLLPFLKTTGKIRNLEKVDTYLERNSQERFCTRCKSKCDFTTLFNNVVVLETEPTTLHQIEKVTLDKISPQLNIGNIPYMLCAVMHFDVKLEHFVAYTRQINGSWNCLDDLKKTVQRVNAATEVHPFILCYATTTRSIDFEKSIVNKKSVLSVGTKSSNQSSLSQHHRQHVPERAARPALAAGQSDEETSSKKRKKNRNMSKNRKKNKFQ